MLIFMMVGLNFGFKVLSFCLRLFCGAVFIHLCYAFKVLYLCLKLFCGAVLYIYATRLGGNRCRIRKNTILDTFAGGPAFAGLGLTLLVPLLFLAPLLPPPPLPPPWLLLPRPPRPDGWVWRLVLVEL